ncbi:hypothetical protein [Saccharopolyspora rosea]|uniref:DUF3558 domain-containing protein n=1 Tax=Saccharopolyspora rosea TaxID=524884 RepID=A0ABW3FYZ8_9PSEU|nr:hypothetical protein [Saccharopolyspora rosea]
MTQHQCATVRARPHERPRRQLPRKLLVWGCALFSVCAVLALGGRFLPYFLASRGYVAPPDPCRAVSGEIVRQAFDGGDVRGTPHAHGTTERECRWSAADPDPAHGGWLTAAAEVSLGDRELPDVDNAERSVRAGERAPGAITTAVLGRDAVISRSGNEVRLVTAQANLVVQVDFDDTDDDPLSDEEVRTALRLVAEEVLEAAGQPR